MRGSPYVPVRCARCRELPARWNPGAQEVLCGRCEDRLALALKDAALQAQRRREARLRGAGVRA